MTNVIVRDVSPRRRVLEGGGGLGMLKRAFVTEPVTAAATAPSTTVTHRQNRTEHM